MSARRRNVLGMKASRVAHHHRIPDVALIPMADRLVIRFDLTVIESDEDLRGCRWRGHGCAQVVVPREFSDSPPIAPSVVPKECCADASSRKSRRTRGKNESRRCRCREPRATMVAIYRRTSVEKQPA